MDVESIVQMRSASTAWPSRLLAAAIALVLTVAYVVGAYAHAVGHQAPHAGQTTNVSDAGGHADHASALAVAGDADSGHDDDRTGHALDCYDTICNGGQAILAADAVVPASLMATPSIEPAATLHGADPGGLDRPPKPFRSA